MLKEIIGSKGGKGGGSSGRAAVEAKDSLRSKAFAQVLDLVSEGEIEGLVDGLKSVYIDGTPIQNADGSYNFSGVEMVTRTGTQSQSYIPGFADVQSAVSVGAEVKKTTSVTRHIVDSNLTAVRVTLGFPQLTNQDTTTGDLNGTSVQIAIDLQTNGGGFNQVASDTITGKTTSRYQRSYRIPLTGSGPWDVRVRRITDDSTSTALQNKTYWDTYTEIVDAKLRYPNSALVGIKIDSSQFQSIPARGYDVKMLRVRVPSNYNPTTRAYTGTWDGTFQIAWTDNPAWCFYDLVTSTRYGLGGLVDSSMVDKWALYTIGKYCDELIPNGLGGTEPRFTCNLYLQTRAEAFKVLRDFASIFRGMVYWSTGSVTATQDAPSDPVAMFTAANVIDSRFNYEGSSLKSRHTVALVTWNDPADLYTQKVEYVEDADGIARYGVQQTEIVALGCTSRGQANRVGRWLLYSERYETEVVQFQVGLDGAMARPGNIIKISDPNRAGARLGGRVITATTTTVTVDKAPDLPFGVWSMYCQMLDGSIVETPVGSVSGSVVTLASAMPAPPTPQSIWVLTGTTAEAQTFRVVSVTEDEGGTLYTVSALKHEPLKYDAIELGLKLQPRDYTLLNDVPSTPSGFVSTESLYRYQAEVRSKLSIGWAPVDRAFRYVVEYRKDLGNWIREETQSADYELLDTTPGTYDFRIYAKNPAGLLSAALSGSVIAFGKTAPPADVASLTAVVDPSLGVTLTWSRVADLDVDVYEVRSGASWSGGGVIGQVYGTFLKLGLLPTGSATYWVKALDTSGAYSQNAASTTFTISAAPAPSVSASVVADQLVLTWTATQGSLATDYYEIRYGSSFAAGTSLGTIKGTSFSTKIQWSGSRQFWVAAVDLSGNIGTAGQASATANAPLSVTMTPEVVDNNVLLRWTDATSTLPIDFYELRKGATWASATVIGRVSARFAAIFETVSGTYTYWITGYDVAGNEGVPSSISTAVSQPPDYSLNFNRDSDFNGQNFEFNGAGNPEGWYANGGTTTVIGGELVIVSTGGDPMLVRALTDQYFYGCEYPVAQIRLRRVSGSGWQGQAYYTTPSHDEQEAYTKISSSTPPSVGEWATIEFDMTALTAGGNDWVNSRITGVRFDLGNTSSDVFEIDWIRFLTFKASNILLQDDNTLVVALNTTETWQSHFSTRGWTTPQDQINAGYPQYGMPTPTSAYYEQTVDYGAVLAATKITATMTSQTVAGSMTITPTISYKKNATDAWTNYAGLNSVFVSDFRYVKVRYDFASSGGDDLTTISNVNIRFDVKQRNDSGSVNAVSTDSGGTTVTFNVAFVDVSSITLSPKGTAARIAVYDFVDVPNPTSFKVLLFDTSGNRVSGEVGWSVKGV